MLQLYDIHAIGEWNWIQTMVHVESSVCGISESSSSTIQMMWESNNITQSMDPIKNIIRSVVTQKIAHRQTIVR